MERLFNITYNICYYHRGCIKSRTIKELIIFYASRFNLEVQEAWELETFFTIDKIKALKEQKEDKSDNIKVLLISNTEEVDQGSVESDLINIHSKPEFCQRIPKYRFQEESKR